MSPRAKRVLVPVLVGTLILFVTFLAHTIILGTSAFPGGHTVNGRYLVEEHGKVFEFTAGQYWLSYIHGVMFITAFAASFVLLIVFYCTGDLKEKAQVRQP